MATDAPGRTIPGLALELTKETTGGAGAGVGDGPGFGVGFGAVGPGAGAGPGVGAIVRLVDDCACSAWPGKVSEQF